MRFPSVIVSMGIGLCLLGAGAKARSFNDTAITPLLPVSHVKAANPESNINSIDDEERVGPQWMKSIIDKWIFYMTPAVNAIKELNSKTEVSELQRLQCMDKFIERFNKYSLIQKETLHSAYKSHFDDQEEKLRDLIISALMDPSTKPIGQHLQWLHHGTTPKDVLKELNLDNVNILTNKDFSMLLDYIDSYNIKNSDHRTTLYDTLLSCFDLKDLESIAANGKLSKDKKIRSVVWQINWMIESKDPKELFMMLQAETLSDHYSKFREEVPIYQQLFTIRSDLKMSENRQITLLLDECATKIHDHSTTESIDQRIRELLKKEWAVSNDNVTEFLTQLREHLQYYFFKSWKMKSWIEYVNAYNIRKSGIRTKEFDLNTIPESEETYLRDFTTFEESDVIRMVFTLDAPRKGMTESIWLNDLMKYWIDKTVLPTEVFDKLEVGKVEDFIGTVRFKEWLSYYEAFYARNNKAANQIILLVLKNHIGKEKLMSAIIRAPEGRQKQFFLRDSKNYRKTSLKRKGKFFQNDDADLNDLISAFRDAGASTASDIGETDTTKSKRSRKDRQRV